MAARTSRPTTASPRSLTSPRSTKSTTSWSASWRRCGPSGFFLSGFFIAVLAFARGVAGGVPAISAVPVLARVLAGVVPVVTPHSRPRRGPLAVFSRAASHLAASRVPAPQEMDGRRILIFCETKKGCDAVTRQLRMDGWPALSIHGDKSQHERDWVRWGRGAAAACGLAGRQGRRACRAPPRDVQHSRWLHCKCASLAPMQVCISSPALALPNPTLCRRCWLSSRPASTPS